MTMPRAPRAATLLLLGALALAPYPQSPAAASCVGPSLDLPRGAVLAPGERHEVGGSHFVDGCRDTMTCSIGCDDCEYDEPPPEPIADVDLTLRQGGRTWTLDTADASGEEATSGEVSWSFRLPPEVRPGPARLVADAAAPVRIRIARENAGAATG